jgi:GTP-binding protein
LLFTIPSDADSITNEYRILLNELKLYNPQLLDKSIVLAITKSDLLDGELKEEISKELPEEVPTIFISSISGAGLIQLKDIIWKHLNQ